MKIDIDIFAVMRFVSIVAAAAVAAYAVRFCLLELGWLRPREIRRRALRHSLALVVILALLSRAALYYTGTALEGFDGTLAGFLELWSGPDTGHFVRISQYGYEPGTEYANNIVFYPLYPLLIRVFSLVFRSPELSGMIVSGLSFTGACALLYLLCVECGMSQREGVAAAAFMTVFPFSVFTLTCYTESLFLLLTIGCALMLKKRKWLFAGLLGMLAALTRTQGVLCFAMAVYELAVEWRAAGRPTPRALWSLLIPAGFGAYLLLNLTLYGDAFAFAAYESAAPWYQSTAWFFDNIAQHVQLAMSYPGLAQFIYLPQIILFFAVLAALAAGIRMRLRTSVMLYGCLSVIVSYSASWLISGGRYMLAVFPIYMVAARFAKKRPFAAATVFVCSCAFAVFYMAAYLHGEAVM